MTLEMLLVVVLSIAGVILFATEPLPVDLTATIFMPRFKAF